ncbi:phage tail fiber protein [Lysinibacillus parviboronicapiens]|uniref:phage tail fiber protein n=1 Tax=Lysinibacillus parviboronicapiens TaxID=436516 RepID=UPI003B75B8AC
MDTWPHAASYSRQSVAFATPTDGQISNSADVLFPIASESWGDISHIGIYDAKTAGNLKMLIGNLKSLFAAMN